MALNVIEDEGVVYNTRIIYFNGVPQDEGMHNAKGW
jgi:hypothetical protein